VLDNRNDRALAAILSKSCSVRPSKIAFDFSCFIRIGGMSWVDGFSVSLTAGGTAFAFDRQDHVVLLIEATPNYSMEI